MSRFSFTDLSPDLILDAIESLGIYVESGLLPLNSYENRVYQFIAEDKLRYVVKFYRPQRWTKAQILEEHEYALELDHAEVPLVAPMVINGQSLFEHQEYWFALFPSVGGRIFEVDNLDHLEWMGRFIARIHLIGQAKPFVHRPTITTDEYLHQAGATIKQSGFVPDSLTSAFNPILDFVIDKAQQQFFNTDEIRLHGDCHPGNILWRDGAPHFVDLDDSRMGPAIQDLWMMISGDRNNQLIQLDTLISGYEEFREFDQNQFKLIEPLRAMRMINYMAWLAKRWEDPAFPRNFSWFGEDKYWEQQILALKEQLAVLNEPALSLKP
ncbi:MAG: Ser/Thr protein kinase RdoA (MazF antagonist) [Phenylobacterium sp.]|jgi:Ser/Thr protein kinase RdoA (MazF antagonist)